MSTNEWMTIRVVLAEQAGVELEQPPGRVLLAHPDHTFGELAEAIDTAFGRWDLTPLHSFEVDGRLLLPDPEPDDDAEPSGELTLGQVGPRPGTRFTYVFDLGEDWTHECTVEEVDVEAFEGDEEEPDAPVPVFGWGTIPDQYGRLVEDDDDEDDEDAPEAEPDVDDDDDDLDDEDLDDDEQDEDEEDEDLDDEELASWDVVAAALAPMDAEPDAEALRAATARLRGAAGDVGDSPRADVLWAAADLELDAAPSNDEELWLRLAAAVVDPEGDVPLDAATVEAWAALEPADWAGAVIELVRSGEGTPATPEAMIELIERCPEIEGEELDEDDEAVILAGLEVVVGLWRVLGALDEDGSLTPLGIWGLPRSLQRAWTT